MRIHFPRLYSHPREMEPCAVTIPFASGAFPEHGGIRLMDGERELPAQLRPLSRYEDGSVKFLQIFFQADLPANRGKDLILERVEKPGPLPEGIRVRREKDGLRLDSGAGGLRFTVRENAEHLFSSLADGNKRYAEHQFAGPRLQEKDGPGWYPVYRTWQIEEAGPLESILRGEGDLLPETPEDYSSQEHPRFETKLTVYAGKPWLEVAFRLINATSRPLAVEQLLFSILDEEGVYEALPGPRRAEKAGDSVGEGSVAAGTVLQEQGVFRTTGVKMLGEIEAKMAQQPVRCCVGRSNYRTNFTISGGEPVEEMMDHAALMAEANEHFIEVFYGTFFADRTARDGGVCATVFQAQQNVPKAVRSDRNGISLMLVPPGADEVIFESGMSREQRFLLHFHGADTPIAALDRRSLLYQMPDRAWLDPEVWRDAGVVPDIFVPAEQMIPAVEMTLISRCDAHSRSFGMLNFGDAPDMNYTQQGRGKGQLVWTNNEYDFPHACALQYMRTGERRFLDYLIAAATHWMDVDVCHYSQDPLRIGGQWEHCRKHVLDSTMVCSHEWVEGLLDLYHLTGEARALRTALGIGENVRRLLDTPAYQTRGESNARETGWALRTLTALYMETGEAAWLEKAEWIVDNFRAWMEEYGGWVAPYTDNTLIHVPFMIAVAMGSLYRYYEVRPGEAVKRMLLSAAEDLIQNCMTPYGVFIYKELPSLNRLGNNTLVLEALTIAWKLSGDLTYLKKGIPTFRREMAAQSRPIGKKVMREGAVILENEPPKSFAQSFLPVALFYKAAAENGLL